MNLFTIFISAVLINNIILSKFLGMCPFLGVSKKSSSAIGMGGAVIFVEVRSRATGDFGDAAETVDRAKRRNLLRAAEAYILERGLNDVEIRFDIIAVRNDMIEHIPNAFYGYWN